MGTRLSGCWEPVLPGVEGAAGVSGKKPGEEDAPGSESPPAPGRRAEARGCHVVMVWAGRGGGREREKERAKEEKKWRDILKEEFKFTKDWLKGRLGVGRKVVRKSQ